MEIDADTDMRPHRLAHRRDIGQRTVELLVRIDELQFLGAIHLHRGEAARDAVLRRLRDLARPVAADPGIDADAVAALAAEQLMHRHTQRLALDVPQRLVDAGERAHVHAAAAIEPAAIQHRPVILDLVRVLADQIVGQFLHLGGDSCGAAFDHRLAPARDALIGIDLQEQPARRHQERRQLGDLHRCLAFSPTMAPISPASATQSSNPTSRHPTVDH